LNTTTNKSKETKQQEKITARANNGMVILGEFLTFSAVQKLHHTFRPKIITQNSAFLDQEQFF